MRKKSVLYYFDKSLVEPIPRLHGTRQMELIAGDRDATVVSAEPPQRSRSEQIAFDEIRESLGAHGVGHDSITPTPRRMLEIARAFFVLLRHARAGNADILHCRSYMPSVAGWLVTLVTKSVLVFDMRGLFVDEYVYAGAFEEGSLRYRIGRWLERKLLASAGAVIVVSERFREHLQGRPDLAGIVHRGRLHVIPNRTEVSLFMNSGQSERDAVREEFGWSRNTIGVFSGSTAAWHRVDHTIEIAARIAARDPKVRFLFLVYPDASAAVEMAERAGIDEDYIRFLTVSPQEVPRYLAAGDFSFMLIEPHLSKEVCAPIKFAEYMAAGLPVVAGGGLGDTRRWISEHGLGVLVDQTNADAAALATLDMLGSRAFTSAEMARACRDFAAERLDMALTRAEYEAVYQELDRT